jgi:hypothetical protein
MQKLSALAAGRSFIRHLPVRRINHVLGRAHRPRVAPARSCAAPSPVPTRAGKSLAGFKYPAKLTA